MNNFRLTEALVNDHIASLRAGASHSRAVRASHRARFRRRRGRAPSHLSE
jgi:hypothetical protein